ISAGPGRVKRAGGAPRSPDRRSPRRRTGGNGARLARDGFRDLREETLDNSIEDTTRRLLKITVGVMGSAGGQMSEGAVKVATEMGRVIASRGFVLVTGACPGLPHYAVQGAKSAGGIVVGISPALNFEEHCIKYHSPYEGYDMLVYTGSGLMGREIENIRSCDLVVFMGGRSGTLGEFAIAYDEEIGRAHV